MLIGQELFYTVSLRLVNYLTCEKGFKIMKVKRDMRNSFVVYFYFLKSDELLQAVKEFKDVVPEDIVIERLAQATSGTWRTSDGEVKS